MKTKSARAFAEENGVTLRAVQAHMKKYAAELEGHIVRYGAPRGTYLDETAQEIIAAHLVKDPVAVMDTALTEEVERLRAELDEARRQTIALLEEKAALSERALKAETAQALAEATQEDQERRIQEAEERAAAAEETIRALKNRSLWQRITRRGE